MMAPGHIVVGLATYQGICSFYGYQPELWYYLCVGLGSLLPDIDHPRSQVGRVIPTISMVMAKTFGHRGFTHSLAAVVVFSWLLLLSSTFALGASAAFCLGYLSHVWADFHSKSGIPLFWPYQGRIRCPLLVYRTNGVFEHSLTIGLSVLMVWGLLN